MNILERILGDPEARPLEPGPLFVPDEEIEPDDYNPDDDMGDADHQAAADAAAFEEPKPKGEPDA